MGGRLHTPADEAYMLENYYNVKAWKIAEILGIPTAKAVVSYAQVLKVAGKQFRHKPYSQVETDRHDIRDGYDTVPWHMRQSTRNQHIIPVDYDETGLTSYNSECYDDARS